MSSWFGESLSNLKGQLQNFTKEVLSEAGEAEAADEAVSLRAKCEELQSVCDAQALEISALRKQNNELQRRLQGDDSKTAASKPEEDDGSTWWSVEQQWDASYFGGSSPSSSSTSAGGKHDRKGKEQPSDEIQQLREKLALLERQRDEAEGCKEENRRLATSIKELNERIQKDTEERQVLQDKLKDATGKVLELEGELQKVQKQLLESLGDSQRRVVETEIGKLEAEKRRLSSEVGCAVDLLGDPEQQEVIHGTLQALELENQVLKIRNAQLELAAKASSSKGSEAGWDTLEDHDSRGGRTARPSDAPTQYEDDFDTLSVRSEASEFSLQHRKQLEAQLAALQEEADRNKQLRETWSSQKVELEEKVDGMRKKLQDAETREAEGRRLAAEDKKCLTLEIEAMSKVVQDLETQLASLKEENAGLCSSLEELDSQHQGVLDQLLKVKDGLARDNETLRTRMLELVEEKAKESLDATQLAEAVARAFEGLRWRKETLERKVVELSRERAELDNMRGALPPIPEEGEAEAWLLVARDGMESLEGELEALREDKKEAEAKVRQLEDRERALEGELDQLRGRLSRLEAVELELDQAKNATSDRECELGRLRGQLSRLEAVELELEQARVTKSDREKTLEAELDNLRGQQSRLEAVNQELEQARVAKSDREEALEKEINNLRGQLSRLETVELELEQAKAAKRDTEKTLEAELDNVRGQLGHLEALELELEQARTTKSDREKNLECEVDNLRCQVSRLEAVKQELEQARAAKSDREETLEKEISNLRGQLSRLEAVELELEQARVTKSDREKTLEAELDNLRDRLSRLETVGLELEQARADKKAAEEALRSLEAEVEMLRSDRERLEQAIADKVALEDLRTLHRELELVRAAACDSEKALEALELELTQERAAKDESERALEALREKTAALETQLLEKSAVLEAQMLEKTAVLEAQMLEKTAALEAQLLEKTAALEALEAGAEKYDAPEQDEVLSQLRVLEAQLEEQNAMGKETVARLSEVVRDKDAELERLRLERDELVRTVHLKHQESLQYHALLTQNLQQQDDGASKEAALQRELERLRQHMVSVEEAYTQETLRAEERAAQLLRRLGEAEETLKASATAHTSASILANQQVEALREQARALVQQRDEAKARLADAEEQALRQTVALRNLQAVLDKFQRDKDRDVLQETAKVRKQLELSEAGHLKLEADLRLLRDQLTEAKEALKAAARLGEQLEAKDEMVRTLKARVAEVEAEALKAQEEAQQHADGAGGKVDRDLVKNLVLGYFSAPPPQRTPVLRVLADVLQLTVPEGQQLGLAAAAPNQQQPSLSEAFVRFLESESQPQRQLRLLPKGRAGSPAPSGSGRTPPPTASLLLADVALPTLARNTGAILKDVLKDS